EAIHGPHAFFHRQTPHFEDDRRGRIVVDGHLGVGGLGVVIVAEPAAKAHHTAGEALFTQGPAGLVHLVDALVSDVPAAIVPEPVPVVMHGAVAGRIPMRRLVPGRTGPKVVIDVGRDLLGPGSLSNARPRLVAEAPDPL